MEKKQTTLEDLEDMLQLLCNRMAAMDSKLTALRFQPKENATTSITPKELENYLSILTGKVTTVVESFRNDFTSQSQTLQSLITQHSLSTNDVKNKPSRFLAFYKTIFLESYGYLAIIAVLLLCLGYSFSKRVTSDMEEAALKYQYLQSVPNPGVKKMLHITDLHYQQYGKDSLKQLIEEHKN